MADKWVVEMPLRFDGEIYRTFEYTDGLPLKLGTNGPVIGHVSDINIENGTITATMTIDDVNTEHNMRKLDILNNLSLSFVHDPVSPLHKEKRK